MVEHSMNRSMLHSTILGITKLQNMILPWTDRSTAQSFNLSGWQLWANWHWVSLSIFSIFQLPKARCSQSQETEFSGFWLVERLSQCGNSYRPIRGLQEVAWLRSTWFELPPPLDCPWLDDKSFLFKCLVLQLAWEVPFCKSATGKE